MTEKEQFEHIIRRFYGADDNAYEAANDLTELLWPAIEHLAKNRFVGLSSAVLDERANVIAIEAWNAALDALMTKLFGDGDITHISSTEMRRVIKTLRRGQRT